VTALTKGACASVLVASPPAVWLRQPVKVSMCGGPGTPALVMPAWTSGSPTKPAACSAWQRLDTERPATAPVTRLWQLSGWGAGLTARVHLRCRAKKRAASSTSNHGVPVCPPRFACSVFSLVPKASNRSRTRCRSIPSSSHCIRN
jgi:hypothetical protein